MGFCNCLHVAVLWIVLRIQAPDLLWVSSKRKSQCFSLIQLLWYTFSPCCLIYNVKLLELSYVFLVLTSGFYKNRSFNLEYAFSVHFCTWKWNCMTLHRVTTSVYVCCTVTEVRVWSKGDTAFSMHFFCLCMGLWPPEKQFNSAALVALLQVHLLEDSLNFWVFCSWKHYFSSLLLILSLSFVSVFPFIPPLHSYFALFHCPLLFHPSLFLIISPSFSICEWTLHALFCCTAWAISAEMRAIPLCFWMVLRLSALKVHSQNMMVFT